MDNLQGAIVKGIPANAKRKVELFVNEKFLEVGRFLRAKSYDLIEKIKNNPPGKVLALHNKFITLTAEILKLRKEAEKLGWNIGTTKPSPETSWNHETRTNAKLPEIAKIEEKLEKAQAQVKQEESKLVLQIYLGGKTGEEVYAEVEKTTKQLQNLF